MGSEGTARRTRFTTFRKIFTSTTTEKFFQKTSTTGDKVDERIETS